MKYINDIYNAPVYHWLMFMKHNNLAFLQTQSLNISPKNIGSDNSDSCFDSYHDIRDQITHEFGVDDSFIRTKKEEEEILNLKLDYLITGDRFKQTMYQLREAGQKPATDTEPHDFDKEIINISRALGGGLLDIKKTSIYQYYAAKHSLKNG